MKRILHPVLYAYLPMDFAWKVLLILSVFLFQLGNKSLADNEIKQNNTDTTGIPTISYPVPPSYTLNSTISPLTPASSNVAPIGYKHSLAVAIGKIVPQEVAIDNKGYLYITDPSDNALYKMPLAGGTPVNIAPSLVQQYSVAVDDAGNVYTTDNSTYIEKIPVNGGPPVVIGEDQGCTGLALDIYGNLYAVNYSSVMEFPATGGAPVSRMTGTYYGISGLAVDNSGNLYTCYKDQIWKIPTGSNQQVVIATLSGPASAIAVDATGNLFVTYVGTAGTVLAELNFNTDYKVKSLFTNIGVDPYGVTIGASGNLYVIVSNRIRKYAPTGGFYIGPVLPGLSFDENTGIISGTPTIIGANNYTVTAYNSSGSASANLFIKVGIPNDDTLKNILLSSGTLLPAFSPAITSYTDSVGNDSISVTPIPMDTLETMAVNGINVNNENSVKVPLLVGLNPINIVATSSNGAVSKTYTVTVKRSPPSSNALLSNIVLNNGTLSPAFNPSVTSYTAISNYVNIMVTPTAVNQFATIKVNGQSVNSGSPSPGIPLTLGANTLTITVMAQDGTIKDYTLTITRVQASSVNGLKGIFLNKGTLAPAFNPEILQYTVTESEYTNIITVRPQPGNPNEMIMVNDSLLASGKSSGTVSQPLSISVGTDTINISVAAQNGLIKNYIIYVKKPQSSNNDLYNLVISKGMLSPAFNNDSLTYVDSVSNDITEVLVHAKLQDQYATLRINGVVTPSTILSPNFVLNAGNNYLRISVTAQNGTVRNFVIIVVRAPSSNADLINIILTKYPLNYGQLPLSPAFNSDSLNYTLSVGVDTSMLITHSKTSVSTSTLAIDGTVVTRLTSTVPLNVGLNPIIFMVTAQDGVTTKTYTVNVTRGAVDTSSINTGKPSLANDGLTVHKAITPNGDGINDVLMIDKITAYPNNKLMVISSSGALVYEVNGYDNKLKVFDGHSSITGKLQPPGTYFYSLQYTVNGKSKTTTGYIVLKY